MLENEQEKVACSQFADRPAADALSEPPATPVLLLLLESPHTSECRFVAGRLVPVAPAQGTSPGDAGGAIRRYLPIVAGKLELPAGRYRVVIANPVQYHCSLGHWYGELHPKIRNHVWKQIRGLEFIQRELKARLATYNPAAVLNCCTDALKADVKSLLPGEYTLYEAPHPAVKWNIHKEKIPVKLIRRAEAAHGEGGC